MRTLEEKRSYFDLPAENLARIAVIELMQAREGWAAAVEGKAPAGQRGLARELSDLVVTHLGQTLTVNEMARHLHVTPRHLNRICNQYLGQSPKQFALRMKIAEAKRMLLSTSLDVGEVALKVGFEDPRYFARVFRKMTGSTPTRFRSEHIQRGPERIAGAGAQHPGLAGFEGG